ncbi:MAG: HAD-IC family P-type ATPase [Methanobacteriota archaeon]|nr:MAG: HAD-IC family P-type ATPase [Euryarchaeota archaeon]
MSSGDRRTTEDRWFEISAEESLKRLGGRNDGLSQSEAEERQANYGRNEIVREKPKGTAYYLVRQINQPLIYVLLAAAVVTSYLQEWIDVGVIIAVVVANTAIGFAQERKAGRAIQELLRFSELTARVRRDGQEKSISSVGIVPGDILLLQAGDMVPADARLIVAKDFFVDESILTGESQPALKNTDVLDREWLIPADQTNMAFSGTMVVRGRAEALVVSTGEHMEISRISQELRTTVKTEFPMIVEIERLGKILSILVASTAIFAFASGLLRDQETVYAFRASVALAVAAIPEGLPALVTVVLASGVREMARRNAIVRSLPAVEALGSTTVICSDKTGTLTLNRMTVVKVFAGGKDFDAEPPYYSCVRHCDYPGPVSVDKERDLYDALAAGMMCNDAVISDDRIEGDPTETALLHAADAAGVKLRLQRIDEIPFETSVGYMATLHEDVGSNVIFVKGAPEKVLSICDVQELEGKTHKIDEDEMRRKAAEMAGEGLRVLAVAMKRVPEKKTSIQRSDLRALVLLGLIGMFDPPRPEAKEAIVTCSQAGIRVVMITGDHSATAESIGRDLGIVRDRKRIVTGKEIQAMGDAEVSRALDDSNIFARMTPEHKLRLVDILMKKNEVVAVTGDGVNDAPALKAASIGVAMGRVGTDVARETADIVLRDDNFATIVAAVEEGRNVYTKIQKILAWTIPTNIGEAMILMIAIAVGLDLPLEPLQILWINLVTAILLAMPLAFEPKEPGLLLRSPRPRDESIITNLLMRKFVIVSTLMVAGTFGIFYLYSSFYGETLAVSQTVALNTLVFFEMFYLFNSRSLTESAFSSRMRTNIWLIVGVAACFVSQLLITYFPPLNDAFHTGALGIVDWVISFAIASSVFFAVEIEKMLRRRREDRL